MVPPERSELELDDQNDEEVEPSSLTELEFEDLEEAEPSAESVSYSGTDFDAEGLVRRLNRGDIVIPTFGHGDPTLETAGFQRSFVWRKPQMDRFIESLLLGFPIPGIMLVQQLDRRYLVLDGQQRLRTLSAFYSGIHQAKEFSLENVATPYKGLTYKTLTPEQKRTLDNTFIQATIVKTDGSNESLETIYQVFERLNSGGTQLTAHEIRIALYPGKLVDLLAKLNKDEAWRSLYGKVSPRVRDQELLLRITALYLAPDSYVRPQKKFLNDFLGAHRNLEGIPVKTLESRFGEASKLLLANVGRSALRFQGNRVNAALSEAIFVGLMRRLDRTTPISAKKMRDATIKLTRSAEMASVISGSTAGEESVRTRLDLATAAFAKV